MSPDGNWIAKMYDHYWHSYIIQVIEVENNQGKVVWSIPYQGTIQSGDPYPYMMIYGWAPDSSGLYFYYAWGNDGWYNLFQGRDLQSLDMKTGDLSDIVNGCCIAFAFLSDMNKVVYTRGDQVGVFDIAANDDRRVKIRSDSIQQAGYIHVAPDENGLVFTVLLDMDGNARVIYLDFATMKQTIIFDEFIENFDFDGWTQAENPRYKVYRGTTGRGSYEIIEIDKKTADILNVGPPTPGP